MTDAKKLYESWIKIRRDPKYFCEHKNETESLLVTIADDICKPCDGYNLGCKHYQRSGE